MSTSSGRLASLGFDPHFSSVFEPHRASGLTPGRVVAEDRGRLFVAAERGDVAAEAAGLLRQSAALSDRPSVGDWVGVRELPGGLARVEVVLPRRSAFVRAVAGGVTRPQVVAANVDVAFVACAIGEARLARRLERYLAAVGAGGAAPVVVLTKLDTAGDPARLVRDAESVAGGRPVLAVSAVTGAGVDDLAAFVGAGVTAAIVGPSGAGKSTLANRLLGGSWQEVSELAADGRGRHTTTRRELLALPAGGAIVDTPGMRELRLWDEGVDLDEVFDDVARLAQGCRFRDCRHETEPGCAVRRAVDDGDLDEGRLASHAKLTAELALLAERKDARAAAEGRRRDRVFARAVRATLRAKGRK